MPLPPSRPKPVPRSPDGSLSISPVLTSLDSGVLVRISWPVSYLELLRWMRGFSYFQRKDESKRFPESFYPLPWTRLLCSRWRVVEIYALIGLHILVWYWFSEYQLTQSNPFCTSIISSNQITRAHNDNIIINNGHCSKIRISFGWCKCYGEKLVIRQAVCIVQSGGQK